MSSLLSVPVINTTTKSSLWRKGFTPASASGSQSSRREIRKEVQAGAEAEPLEEGGKAGRRVTASVDFLTPPSAPCQGRGTASNELGRPTSIRTEDSVPTDMATG